MSLAVAIQMDPIETIDIDGDSTFVLALEGQARGHRLYHYLPQHLSLRDGRVSARARALTVRRDRDDHFTLGAFEEIDLAALDVVLMRQDPPFDMAYITATHMLEHVHPDTLVVNDPVAVRNAPEKLFVTHFAELMPPTLITSDKERIDAFRAEHEDIIVKPLYGNGGAGVFHIAPGDDNLNALLEMFAELYREPVMVQRFLPEVRGGDKRIILIDGEPAGAVNRVPPPGEARSNMHVGGRPEASELTDRDREICAAIGPSLRDRGLIFAGIDVIGGLLTEINVTSPTGLQEINNFDGARLEAGIWDAIERRRVAAERLTAFGKIVHAVVRRPTFAIAFGTVAAVCLAAPAGAVTPFERQNETLKRCAGAPESGDCALVGHLQNCVLGELQMGAAQETTLRRAGYEACLAAAQAGLISAQTTIGEYLLTGIEDVLKPDFDLARQWLETAATAGHDRAQYDLAHVYRTGLGLDAPDPGQGIEWMARAAAAGMPIAILELGEMHLTGEGVAVDPVTGRDLIATAAELEFAPAQIRLASVLYDDATGGAEFDPIAGERALYWACLVQRRQPSLAEVATQCTRLKHQLRPEVTARILRAVRSRPDPPEAR